MAGFRKDVTTSANTAIMSSASLVGSLLSSGVISTVDEALDAAGKAFDMYLEKARPVVEADNALFAEVEGAGGTVSKLASAPSSDSPGDTAFTGGKFKGQTIAQVYGMTAEQAAEFGHTYGAGSTYIVNYVATEKNSNGATRAAAQAYLAQVA